MTNDDMTTNDKAANGGPAVRHVSSRLTPAEIDALREDKKRSGAYLKEHFALQAGQKTDPSPLSNRLSLSEIEQLQRNKKESIAYGRKAFQKK